MARRLVVTAVAALALALPPGTGAAGLLALGDSYSSGQGAPPYEPGTTGHGNTCYRSGRAWPQVLAVRLGLAALPSPACNGAVTADVLYSDPRRRERERRTSQIARLAGDPDIVTITIGGNDVHFRDVLTKCVFGVRSCVKVYDKRSGDVIEGWIRDLAKDLPTVYRRIREVAPRARLLVVGYPRLFPADLPNRAAWSAISSREAAYLTEKGRSLNDAIERAADRAGVEFVDVADAFAGHELRCQGNSYVNKLTAAHLWQSFHPTAAGYARLAAVVHKRMRTFQSSPLAP
jgi:lysophospholipase L1-like esterase